MPSTLPHTLQVLNSCWIDWKASLLLFPPLSQARFPRSLLSPGGRIWKLGRRKGLHLSISCWCIPCIQKPTVLSSSWLLEYTYFRTYVFFFFFSFSTGGASMRSQGVKWEVRRWALLNGCFFSPVPCERSANWILKILDLVQRRKACVQCWPLMEVFSLGTLWLALVSFLAVPPAEFGSSNLIFFYFPNIF